MSQVPVIDDPTRRARNSRRVIGAIVVAILLALLLWFFLMRKPAVPPPLAEFGAPMITTDMELCPGLQLITAISQPEGDYESIKTIEAVDAEGVHIRYSSEAPVGDVFDDDYGKMRRMTVTRTVRMEDLQSAAFYAQRWFEGMPEVIPLSTALGVSGRILDELKSKGVSVIGVSNAYAGDPPVNRDERPNIYDYISEGPLKRIPSEPFIVLVDDRLASLPTVMARAAFINEAAEFTFLDDPGNPLTLAFSIGITDNPDNKPESLTLTKIARSCGKPAAGAVPEPDMAEQLKSARRIALYDIHFAFNTEEVREESGPRLTEIAAMMAANPSWRIRIEAHTDSTMEALAAKALSERRAQAIKAKLVSEHGIAADRVEAAGLGADHPRGSNETAEGRARNRRVEIALL